VIVGFPGETDAYFEETRSFIDSLTVSYLHVFPYSERANTVAATLPGKVQDRVKSDRAKTLIQLSEEKRAAFYASQLSAARHALFEERNENGMMEGYTENYVRVSAKYDPLLIGEMKEVVIGPMENGVCQVLEPASIHHSC
jgi:threonylcarbamoyladenosine tRNA methylthiotransferase MtaB